MSHRIVFSDIDGTLLNTERELSTATISEIKRITPDVPVVLISSRMPKAMRHLQETLGIIEQPLICYNGGLILIDNKPIQSTEIPIETIKALSDYNEEKKIHISLYHNDEWYVPEMDFWAQREQSNTKVTPTVLSTKKVLQQWKNEKKGPHKIMCMGTEEYIDEAFQFLQYNFKESLRLYRSKPTYIEIADKNISKLTAVEFILNQHYHISIEDAVAFGDNYNDITMLKAIGTGVAVANAKPETLEIADVVTLSGKEDGVAIYLKNNL